MLIQYKDFRVSLRKFGLWIQALILAGVGIAPLLISGTAMAAPAVQNRQLGTLTGRPSVTNTFTWTFDTTDLGGATNVDHIEIEFCDSPLGACTVPDGSSNAAADNIPILPASPTATLSGSWTSTGNSASRTAGDAGGTANQILVDKTTADDTNNKTGLSIQIAGFTNDNTANVSFYTRVRLYSDTGTTLKWEGVFAQSTSQTLTVNARVQERLDFCVGATTVNDATTSVGAACTNITGTDVNIGNVESGFTNVSPVTATNGGDNENGVAMIRTNAVNGAVVDYKAVQDTSSGKLKVAGATCSGTATTDQCFNSATTTSTTFTAGTEDFGMTIAGINCGSTTSYTCTFSAGTYNLIRDNCYDGTACGSQNNTTYVSDIDQVGGTTSGLYAWDDTGTADRIASSATSSVKVIDDEAMILKFAATAAATTPTGSYTVQTDLYATATF